MMKSLVLSLPTAAVALCLGTPAMAESWRIVGITNEAVGDRLISLVDTDSIRLIDGSHHISSLAVYRNPSREAGYLYGNAEIEVNCDEGRMRALSQTSRDVDFNVVSHNAEPSAWRDTTDDSAGRSIVAHACGNGDQHLSMDLPEEVGPQELGASLRNGDLDDLFE